jgi:hypothetical protein
MGGARDGVGKACRDRIAEVHELDTLGAQLPEWPAVFAVAVPKSIIASPPFEQATGPPCASKHHFASLAI